MEMLSSEMRAVRDTSSHNEPIAMRHINLFADIMLRLGVHGKDMERELSTSENLRLAALSMLEDARAEINGYKASQNLNIECYHDRVAEKLVLEEKLTEANRRLLIATEFINRVGDNPHLDVLRCAAKKALREMMVQS